MTLAGLPAGMTRPQNGFGLSQESFACPKPLKNTGRVLYAEALINARAGGSLENF
jgi:hypothetical protein